MNMVSIFYSYGNTVKFRIQDVHIMGDGCALFSYHVHCKCGKKKDMHWGMEYGVLVSDICKLLDIFLTIRPLFT